MRTEHPAKALNKCDVVDALNDDERLDSVIRQHSQAVGYRVVDRVRAANCDASHATGSLVEESQAGARKRAGERRSVGSNDHLIVAC